ncbi:MAG: UDP-N-acetylenolpyruvoylglucosamine reductase [Bdellovibrionales bacterium RIFOXYD12_FULL_39_22]|nr:MAG: UDP-N-acetylenolpyruvoylglucosamine reductase [Bdellovibrionales bacterium RIFOXYB1_FULL_39_21]OFZ41976.1 MAG: UDP-N-acetylenolpyruvoylglucosamine reductase [Bdellovibrionales bacterium RIFOXYC12_FULL_39_17]OFZ50692.1 MAG: UDP-N-acetylenolpyruvoylglucosamine reductase [Bdellovibrionales bacterium RIFOXYC1_FULL_39_130]OFZ77915.1 MAG: UDP-N-acetylenolpyruvoylglucosamine reductase [Bdellovibrionales bacterium RIFOXYD1_FULL_39_84]OFZ93649.1 MAG: UDP-N-acetylenolpyruvoylglucosamine reductase
MKALSDLENNDISIEKEISLTDYSTMRLRSQGTIVKIKSKEALIQVIQKLAKHQIKYLVIGNGSNLLLKEVEPSPLLKLEFPFERKILETVSLSYNLPAAIHLSLLVKAAMSLGLKGWEALAGIPASLGGAVAMNAGTALGEICQIVEMVKIINSKGEEKVLNVSPVDFKYRGNNFLQEGDVIYEVTLKHLGIEASLKDTILHYLQKRTAEQPLDKKTCGSVFKNIKSEGVTCAAGHYIDIMGMKGFSKNGISVSSKHANFFENEEGGTYSDMVSMMEYVRGELYLQFGKRFDPEVKS